MYTTGNIANMVLPYWNEIKNWSREDRSNLVELIELSLQEDNDDDKKMKSFIDNLDETAMKAAADFAYKESLSQKTIPHSEILNVVKEELGWK